MHNKITLKELVQNKNKPSSQVYITSCAVVIEDMLFVGNTHQECIDRAIRCIGGGNKNFLLGYLGTDGLYYTPSRAGYIAYARRQTERLCDPLQPEDIIVTA